MQAFYFNRRSRNRASRQRLEFYHTRPGTFLTSEKFVFRGRQGHCFVLAATTPVSLPPRLDHFRPFFKPQRQEREGRCGSLTK